MADADTPSPEDLVRGLIDLLDVEALEPDFYRGARQPGGRGRVFGGQVIAQALMAAIRTVEPGRVPHSLHAYFMRPGDEDHPVDYRIERDFDGRSFANRRVVAIQQGKPILNMAASFQIPEQGLEHRLPMPDVPPPEALGTELDYWRANARRLPEEMRRHVLRPRPIEIRPAGPSMPLDPVKSEPIGHAWFRTVAPVDAGPDMHRAILAYMSDMRLMGTAMLPHGFNWFTRNIRGASLDHAVWLHDDFRADEWLLFATDSPWSGAGRGYNRGLVFTRDGRLVASLAQEGLIRDRGPRS